MHSILFTPVVKKATFWNIPGRGHLRTAQLRLTWRLISSGVSLLDAIMTFPLPKGGTNVSRAAVGRRSRASCDRPEIDGKNALDTDIMTTLYCFVLQRAPG
jgi:hypothetical protein